MTLNKDITSAGIEIGKSTKEKQTGIELLRIIAMLLIITQHLAEHTSLPNASLFNTVILNIMYLGGGIGVNVFVLISGYFYTSRFSTKKAAKLILQTVFYSVAMTIIAVLTGAAEFRLKLFPRALFPFIFSGGEYWFITVYILMYIATPILHYALSKISSRYLGAIIIIFLMLWSVLPASIGKVINLQNFSYSNLGWFFLVFLCGAYIRKKEEKGQPSQSIIGGGLLFCVLIMMATKGASAMGVSFPKGMDILIEALTTKSKNGIMQFFIAYLLMILLCRRKFKASKLFFAISSSTFGVYLLHNHLLFNDFLWREVLHTSEHVESWYFVLYAAAMVLVVFAVCSLIENIRKKYIETPFMNSKPVNKLFGMVDAWLMETERKEYSL